MKTWSIPIGRIFGAEMRIHLTFLFLVLFVLLPTMTPNTKETTEQALLLAGIIFASVLVHEIGHAILASLRGVPLRVVMLLPIGGVHLRETTENPKGPSPRDETLVALAGPFTSFLVAGIAAIFMAGLHPDVHLLQAPYVDPAIALKSLVWINVFLGLLNLVPAYPLDGGQVLRSILASERGSNFRSATRRSVMMGQVFATLLIFAGIWNTWLMLVGFFLFVAVQMEDRSLMFQAVIETVRLEDVMLTDFATLSPADTLEDALSKAVHTLQDDFPVIRGTDLVGVISRQKIVEALREHGNGYVQSAMNKVFDVAHRKESLAAAFRKITSRGSTLIPVVDENHLVGIITLQNLMHSMGLLAESRRLKREE